MRWGWAVVAAGHYPRVDGACARPRGTRGADAPASGILGTMASATMADLPSVLFPDGKGVPALGLGTWTMGEGRAPAVQEAAALALGLDLGMTLVDTAEMYGDGGAEEVVARAISGRRDRVFVVSKLYPHNAGRKAAIAACERSLRRLSTDRLDLYLLHWRGSIPLAETLAAFERLRAEGKILRWGVSNFDTADMRELFEIPEGRHCATNQVLYHLAERGIEWELLPWMRERRMPVMAYSPLGQGTLLGKQKLAAIASRVGATPAQVALRWLLRSPDVIAIPESVDPGHLRANRAAVSLRLGAQALREIDAAFPPPKGPTSLAII